MWSPQARILFGSVFCRTIFFDQFQHIPLQIPMSNPALPSPFSFRRARVILAALLGSWMISSAVAQNPVEDAYRKAVQMMEDAKWADAEKILAGVVANHGGANAFQIYGPAFGLIHYHLGLCQMELKKFKEAAKQFETTYKKFTNNIPPEKTDEIPNNRNHYHLIALYQWGRAEQGAEEYAGAIKLYNKFLSEQPEKGSYSAAEFTTNLAVCHAKLGKIPEATSYLQKVYDAHAKINTREKYFLHLAYYDLADQWVAKAMTTEALAFMDKNDGKLRFPPYDSFKYGFAQRNLKLAQEASGGEQNLDALALRIFTLTPRTEDAITELKERKGFYKGETAKANVQKEIDRLQATIDQGVTPDVPGLRLMAYIYEKNGSFRAAYAVHDYMTRQYPVAKGGDGKKNIAPEILYNATRCAFSFGDLTSAQHHGMIFLKKYPGHELEPDVQSMLLEQLFRRGDYASCIKVATTILPKLQKNTPQHDVCLFALSGSHYYDGAYETADPMLEEHAKLYKESAFLEESSYYRGANKVKLLEWEKASTLLDGWLSKYKESSLRAFAILDRATCHFAVDEMDPCLKRLDEIEQRFPESAIYDRSLNLRGDVFQAKKEWAAAEQSYKKAKSLAEGNGNGQVAAEALSQLVPVAVAMENFKVAAGHFDEFKGSYSGNYLEPQVLANAIPALIDESVNRGQEGLDHLEDMIDRLGQQENADLEKAVAKYGEVSVDLNGPEKTISKLRDMSSKAFQPDAVKAWLLVLRIDIIEKELKGQAATAAINTAFGELQGFDKKKLAPYVLARIGDFLRKGGKAPQAVAWFDEILTRPGVDAHDYAKNALAKIYFRGAGDRSAKALEYVDWVLTNSSNTKLTEESAYERAAYFSRKKQWEQAEENWFAYVSNKSWRANSPEAWYGLGKARDELGKLDKALSAYTQSINKYATRIEYSIPALARSVDIQKGRGDNANAFKMARIGLIKFQNFHNEARVKADIERLKKVYRELEDAHLEEGQAIPEL